MTYQDEIKKHFEDNKKKLFEKVLEDGKWRNSVKKYPHILPKEEQILNLLPTYRIALNEYLNNNKNALKKHIYFHHLNSSQAMCLNFFFPLFEEKELDIILNLFGFENDEINYSKTCFEKNSDIEKSDKNYRPTSFDFYIETISGKRIFFEIKYTEQEFGKAKEDDIHLNKFNDVYKNNLRVINEEYHQPNIFLKNYQILRNLICISENSYVVFLYPNKNKKIKNQAESAKDKILNKDIKENLINLTWEELISFTEKNIKSLKLKKQVKDFKEKYNF
ncbi:PGN_0703 family putative restriction endonuclease [Flavobacterium sp. 3HN19-14]|uniref:PGN_0703 family putative restriction endonuclease n=1 Tax=Flavobacterium sp. 3HN19-14 TaxID=3448133 RepID=UPI003EE03F0A